MKLFVFVFLFGAALAENAQDEQNTTEAAPKTSERVENVNVRVTQEVEQNTRVALPYYIPLHTTYRMYDQDIRPDYQEENWYRTPYYNGINPYTYPYYRTPYYRTQATKQNGN